MEIATEHGAGNPDIDISVQCRTPENLPYVLKNPNLEYGIGNLIGNAASFSRHAIKIKTEASAEEVFITIQDDGPGFSPDVMRQIGRPYISQRDGQEQAGTENHLGLGIFIAMNLLEATQGLVKFKNAPEGGAHIEITWPRTALELDTDQKRE